uniref:Molt-inhibiting hormone-like 1 n=1 Tax=Cherax quadricarinatus TaxID=27406 RepID=A0A2U8JAF4_CHEQU|nr:molt-inhibiting hormone-like 1 [Cherax quadricarinatus]
MGNQKSECFYARRVWLLVLIALVVQQSTARFIEDDCPGVVGNRNVHSMVMRVCEDCYNVFRHPEVAVGCSVRKSTQTS